MIEDLPETKVLQGEERDNRPTDSGRVSIGWIGTLRGRPLLSHDDNYLALQFQLHMSPWSMVTPASRLFFASSL